MPKTSLVLPDGTKVTIEGTADEVATLLQRFGAGGGGPGILGSSAPSRGRGRRVSAGYSHAKANIGPADYVRDLVAADFFKAKRGLGDVQRKLEEGAHIYPITTLSPVLFRLVQRKELRRLKEDGTWKYVNP